jgi:hypothetical protein
VTRQPWYDSDNPSTVARGAGWRLAVTIAVVILVASAIGAAVWAVRVATSDVKGRGDSVVKINDADNRLTQQAYFEQTYADIQAAQQNLDLPGNDTEKAGRLSYCRRLVADYNAAARKEIAAKFRAVDLPASIDPTITCPGETK